MPTLAVLGAGPKGIAIAVKARALAEAGLDAPRVVLVDRGAGRRELDRAAGLHQRLLPLGTPAEKDVGLPVRGQLGCGVGRGDRGDGRPTRGRGT